MEGCVRRSRLTWLAAVLLLAGAVANPAAGVAPAASDYLSLDRPDTIAVVPGERTRVTILLKVRPGWHINSHRPPRDIDVPTRLRIPDTSPVSLRSVRYPPGESYRPSFSRETLSVYSGRRRVDLGLGVPEDLSPGRHRVPLRVEFQPCSDSQCLPPMVLSRPLNLAVRLPRDGGEPGGALAGLPGVGDLSAGTLRTTFENRGSLLGWVVVFLLGLSLNLTPCVYPMIPITVGYFGRDERGGGSARLLDALLYLLGMTVVYSLLGAMAGATGSVLGAALQSPVVLVGVALLLSVMAGSMVGLYRLRVPRAVLRGSRDLGRGLGTFGMGMTLGVVAAPCLAPASVALLVYAGRSGSFLTGALLFFVLSLGLGLPYVGLAIFSRHLASLPSAGRWTAWVQKVIGWLLLGTALYFLWPLMTDRWFGYLLVAWLVLGGATLALVDLPSRSSLFAARLLLLLIGVALGVWWVGEGLLEARPPGLWRSGRSVIHGADTRLEGPVVVYVAADWCLPCRRMQMTTFRDRRLRRALREVEAVKVDITRAPPPDIEAWLHERRVFGVPTILFFDGEGREIEDLRAEGYLSAAGFRKRLRRLRRGKLARLPGRGFRRVRSGRDERPGINGGLLCVPVNAS